MARDQFEMRKADSLLPGNFLNVLGLGGIIARVIKAKARARAQIMAAEHRGLTNTWIPVKSSIQQRCNHRAGRLQTKKNWREQSSRQFHFRLCRT